MDIPSANGALFGSYKGTIKDTMLCALDDIGQTSDACQGMQKKEKLRSDLLTVLTHLLSQAIRGEG